MKIYKNKIENSYKIVIIFHNFDVSIIVSIK